MLRAGRRGGAYAQGVQRETRGKKENGMIRRLATIGFAWVLLPTFVLGQSPGPASGTVQGVVFTADADGGRSVVPAAKILLDGQYILKFKPTTKVS